MCKVVVFNVGGHLILYIFNERFSVSRSSGHGHDNMQE